MKLARDLKSWHLHLLSGLGLISGLGAIAWLALSDNLPSLMQLPISLTLALVVLVLGVPAVVVMMLRHGLGMALIPSGFLATLVSRSYVVSHQPGDVVICAIVRVNAGFPFPWYFTGRFVGSRCIASLLPLIIGSLDPSTFLLDLTYYVVIGLAISQIYHSTVLRRRAGLSIN